LAVRQRRWGTKARDLTAKEILDNKLQTFESVQLAYARHMNDLAKAAHDAITPTTTTGER
jgi:hypothetical protein